MDDLAGGPAAQAPPPGGRTARPAVAYALTLAAVLAAFGVRMALAGIFEQVFLLFYPVVALAALFGGRGPALAGSGLATVLAGGWIMPSRHGLPLDVQDYMGLAVFAAVNAGVVEAITRYRATRQRLAALEREAALADARARLEAAEAGQRRSDAAARLSRAQLEAVVNAMSDGVIVVDHERRPVLVNEALSRFTGFPGRSAVGEDLERVRAHYRVTTLDGRGVPLEDWPMSRAMRGESVPQTELRARRDDLGREWVFSFACEPVRDATGRQVLTVGVARDISERVAADEAAARQRALQDQLAAMALSVPGAVFSLLRRPDGRLAMPFVSPSMDELSGLPAAVLAEDLAPALARIHPDDQARVSAALVAAAASLAPSREEFRYLHAAKGPRWLEARMVGHAEPDGAVLFHGFLADVTERREAQEAVRALAARLQAAREEEATRIARDLHDDLGQTLTALQLELRWIEERVERLPATVEAGPLVDRVVAAAELAATTLTTVQRLSLELHPAALDHLGLAAAVRQELRRFEQRTGVQAAAALETDLPPADPAGKALYRIVLEALTNVARHAGATHVAVRLRREGGLLLLTVADDGRGLPPGLAVTPATLGLLGMQERAHALGGEVRLSAGERGGTVVTARIPLPPGAAGGPPAA
jgi:PAS domain S-box-containing protein